MWEKIWEPLNVTKELSHAMLELHNVRIKSSNVRKIKGTVKCEKKKKREPSNVTKVLSKVMLELHNVTKVLSNL